MKKFALASILFLSFSASALSLGDLADIAENQLASFEANKNVPTRNSNGSPVYQCDVGVKFVHNGMVAQQVIHTIIGPNEFDYVEEHKGAWVYQSASNNAEGVDGMQMHIDKSTRKATVTLFDDKGDDVARGSGHCFGGL